MEHGFSEFFLYYFQYFLRFNTLFTTGTNPLLQRQKQHSNVKPVTEVHWIFTTPSS